MSGTCTACGAPGARVVETVEVDRLAAAWARQAVFAAVPAEEVAARVRVDVGAERVTFLRCDGCGLEMAEPRAAWSGGNYPAESYGLAWDHARALEVLGAEPPLRLLELGCADGRFVEAAAALGHRATGVDFSPPAVRAGRARGVDVRLATAGGVSAALEEETGFGAIAMFQIIEHLEDPDAVFAELAALAAPGALLLLGCPAPERYTRRFAHPDHLGRSDHWDYPPQHVLRWTPEALRRFLGRHGWSPVAVEAEPMTVRGAAAHLTALHGTAGGWIDRPLRRRLETLGWMARIAATRGLTGVRLFVVARRG